MARPANEHGATVALAPEASARSRRVERPKMVFRVDGTTGGDGELRELLRQRLVAIGLASLALAGNRPRSGP